MWDGRGGCNVNNGMKDGFEGRDGVWRWLMTLESLAAYP